MMTRQLPQVSTEQVLRELHALTEDKWLLPIQVQAVLECSGDQLSIWRSNEPPEEQGPPFTTMGRMIRYPAGAFREWIKSRPLFKNNGEATQWERDRVYMSFSDFMNSGSLTDVHPFLIVNEKPLEFYSSLKMRLNEEDAQGMRFEMLTLGSLARYFLEWTTSEEKRILNAELQESYPKRVITEL